MRYVSIAVLLLFASVSAVWGGLIPVLESELALSDSNETHEVDDSHESHETAAAAPRETNVPILMYHRVAELAGNAERVSLRFTVSPADFEAQMAYLADHGYHPISLDQLGAFLKSGAALPTKPVVLSFDDGWVCDISIITPVLRRHGFTGTFFIYPNAITDAGGNRFVSWADLRSMASEGMSIESHTLTHPHLLTLSAEQARKEIAESKKTLEAKLGRPVTALAYPFGEYNDQMVQDAREAGYAVAVTTDPGIDQHANKPMRLKRQYVSYGDPIEVFAARLSGK